MKFSLDTETLPTTDLDKAPPLVCLSWAGEDGTKGLLRHDNAKQKFAEILTHHTTITANGAYDMAVALRQWPDLTPLVWQAYDENRVIDIQVAEKLHEIATIGRLYTRHAYGLGAMSEQWLQRPLDKETYRLSYGALRDVPLDAWPEGARKYAIDDAVATLDVHKRQPAVADLYPQTRHAWWLHLMHVWGIRTDMPRVLRYQERLLKEQNDTALKLQDKGLIRLEGKKGWVRNDKAARAYMEKVFPKGPRTAPSTRHAKGQFSVDEIACLDSGDPTMMLYGDYASIKKQLSTDIPSLLEGELHSRFESLQVNGRTSSNGYNLQNPAREGEARPCFVPRPGWVFIDCDYTGLEAYTGAQACITLLGDSDMAEVFRSHPPEDIHIHTAAALMGLSYGETLARYRAGDHDTKIWRQFAKIANYGLAGGMEDVTFFMHVQKELKKARAFDLARSITFETTARIRQTWLERWREWPYYFERNADLVRWGDYQAEQLFSGRKRMMTGWGKYTELNNTYFSGLGADLAKHAGWLVSRECYDPSRNSALFGSRPVNFPHDQIITETPDDDGAHDRAMRQEELMNEAARVWSPDCPTFTEACLARRWDKGAKRLTDSNGRLMVWDMETA